MKNVTAPTARTTSVRPRMRPLVLLTAALVGLGCSSSGSEATPSDASVDLDAAPGETGGDASNDAPATSCAIDALQAKYRSGATEIDFDCDGKVDWKLVRDGANVTKETIDFDGDGKVDYEVDRGANPQRIRIDANFDGKWDLVIERKPGETTGTFDFVELSDPTFRTGTLSYRRRYTLPATTGGKVEVVEESLNGDTWEEVRTTTSTWPSRKIDATIGGAAGACSDSDKGKIEKALEDVEKSIDCLGGYDKSMARRAKWMLAVNDVSIFCKAEGPGESKFCASANNAHEACPFGFCSEMTIQVTPEGLSAPGCGPLSSTLFHELMHYVAGLHRVDDGSADKNDPVYGCERLCGAGEATPENCAACLQTSTGDPRCVKAGGKPRECKQEIAGRCNCESRPKTYPTYTECTVECPSGLGCAFSGCTEIPGPPICEHEDVECTCGCCDGLVCDPVSKKCVPE